jgi:hypothetical protein
VESEVEGEPEAETELLQDQGPAEPDDRSEIERTVAFQPLDEDPGPGPADREPTDDDAPADRGATDDDDAPADRAASDDDDTAVIPPASQAANRRIDK